MEVSKYRAMNTPWPGRLLGLGGPQPFPHNRPWVWLLAVGQERDRFAAELVGRQRRRLGRRGAAVDAGRSLPGCGRGGMRYAEARSQDGNLAAAPSRRGTSGGSGWPR